MAIMDAFLEFSDKESFDFTSTVSIVANNVVNLGATGQDKWATLDSLYPGDWRQGELYLNVQTDVNAAAVGNGNMTVSLCGADVSTDCTPTGGTTVITSGAIPAASYKASGKKLWQVAVPKFEYKFMYLKFTNQTTDAKTQINAWVGLDAEFGHMDV